MKNKKEIILWIKRLVGVLAIITWLGIVYEISQMPEPFTVQAPYCMGATMLIFGLLTLVYKGLDFIVNKGDLSS